MMAEGLVLLVWSGLARGIDRWVQGITAAAALAAVWISVEVPGNHGEPALETFGLITTTACVFFLVDALVLDFYRYTKALLSRMNGVMLMLFGNNHIKRNGLIGEQ